MAETIMPAYSEQGDLNGKFNSLVQLIGPVPSGKTVQGEVDTNATAIGKIVTLDLGAGLTVAELESALVTLAGTMENFQFKNVRFNIGGSGTTDIFGAYGYLGTLKRYNSTRFMFECQDMASSGASPIITGNYNNGWTWESLSSNKTDFMNISATSYSYDSIEGMTEIYNALPDGYRGVIVANFKDGYHPVCQVTRSTSNWGSITAFVDATTAPIYFSVSSGTKNIDKLALNSNLIPSTLDLQDKSYTSGSINDLPYGIYRIYNSVTQIPIAVAGYCSCYLRENGTKLQVYTSDTNRTFTRTKVSGTWSNWEELALNSYFNNIGTIVTGTSSGSTSTTSGTRTEVGSITLTAGTWIVCGMIDWEANGNGYRQATFDTVDTDNPSRSNTSCIMAVTTASKQTYQQVVRILPVVSSQSEVKFYGKQNSGGTLYAYPYIYAVRII